MTEEKFITTLQYSFCHYCGNIVPSDSIICYRCMRSGKTNATNEQYGYTERKGREALEDLLRELKVKSIQSMGGNL